MRTRSRRKVHETIGASAAVAALAMAPLIGASTSSARAAAVQTVHEIDFENGSWAPWVQSGDPTLGVVEDTVLQVANRAHDWDGLAAPELTYEAGVTYTFSARARLAPGTAGSAGFRFVGDTWMGGRDVPITADRWTTITLDHTPTATWTGRVFLGTGDLDGPYTYQVDDLAITRAGAPADVLTSVDFQTVDRDGWTQNGGPSLSALTLGRHLEVRGRAHDYDGITSPVLDLEGGVAYTVSARARLAPGTEGTAGFRFVGPSSWLGGTQGTIGADDWFDDIHGLPAWRRHMALRFAEEIRRELTTRTEPNAGETA